MKGPATQAALAKTFQNAVEQHQAGQLAKAAALYGRVLASVPRHFDTLQLLGVLEGQRGRFAEAERLIGKALAIDARSAVVLSNHANMLRELGRLDEALRRYDQALAIDRSDVPSQAGRGYALLGLKRPEEALRAGARVIVLAPNDLRGLNIRVRALEALKRPKQALIEHRRVLRVRSDLADAWTDLGRLTFEVEGPKPALANHAKALALTPALAEAMNGAAIALRRLERPEEALAWFNRALAIRADFADARFNRGLALGDRRRPDEAIASYRGALALRPDFAEAQQNTGIALLGIGLRDHAIATMNRAAAISPRLPNLWRNRLAANFYSDRTSPADLYRMAIAGAASEGQAVPLPPPDNDPDPDRRLRIGFLSSDFHNHPATRIMRAVFAHRDRANSDFICYAHERRNDEHTDWFRDAADGWRNIRDLTDREVAELIRRDRIDVLVVLAGNFDFNRPMVASWRAAPVQLSMHDGATSGIAGMDYFVGDPILVPDDTTEPFTEQVARIPLVYNYGPSASLPVEVRPPAEDGAVVFGSFNNPAKLTPFVLGLWQRVLARLPKARLVLKYKDDFARSALKDAVLSSLVGGNVGADRVSFAAAGEFEREHLARYGAIDIALDSYPFTGATTSFEALWMGVPVVTLLGDSYLRRMTASHLIPIGLGDLVAKTPDDFVEIAVRLAGDPQRLAELRATLRDRLLASPLMDRPGYARSVDAMFRDLWRRWAGDQPRSAKSTAK